MKNKKKRKREYLGVFFLIILILVLSLLAMFVMRNNHIEKKKWENILILWRYKKTQIK